MSNGNRWKHCHKQKPDDERQVIVARPDRGDTEAAHWFEPEQAWVTAGLHEQIYPTFWRDMPKNPMVD